MNGQRRFDTTALVAKFSILAASLVWSISFSLAVAIDLPTMHLDGAFQTASGLFRLDSGQLIGRDFFPYLGTGPLYLLYPFFLLGGSHLAASVFAAQLATLWAGVMMATLIWHSLSGTKHLSNSIIAGSLIFLLTHLLPFYLQFPLPPALTYATHPGNSLRPLRSLLPFLVFLAFITISERFRSANTRSLFTGILIGVSMLWSNDYAIPTAALLFVTSCWLQWNSNQLSILSVAILTLTSFTVWICLLTLITGGHFISLLSYNFLSVARDQWWYFAPYSENTRFFSLAHLLRIFTYENVYFPLLLLSATGTYFFVYPDLRRAAHFFTGLTLLGGGLLATTGGHAGGYFAALSSWAFLTMIVAILVLIHRHVPVTIRRIGIGIAIFLCLTIVVKSPQAYSSARDWAAKDPGRFYVPELGGFMPREWENYVTFARNHRSDPIIEEYWGIWSAINRQTPVWKVDAVIHALGSIRPLSEQQLDSVEWVVSTRHITSPEWLSWNLSQNYWFYRKLFRSFTPVLLSPATILWKRHTASPPPAKELGCTINKQGNGLIVNAPTAGFYEVETHYRVQGSGRSLIMLQNHISYGADAGGRLSINPFDSTVIFPVYLDEPGSRELMATVIGNTNVSVAFESCKARTISFQHPDVLQVPANPTAPNH